MKENHFIFKHWNYLYEGGFVLILIGIVCFFILFYFFYLNSNLNQALRIPVAFEDKIQERIIRGEAWESIERFLSKIKFKFSRIACYAIHQIKKGELLLNIFSEVRQTEITFYERNILILSAFVSAAPLLGLLGTILGMVQTFDVLAMHAARGNHLISAGIQQALITTQFGLFVALPGLFGVSYLKKRVRQLEVKLFELELHFAIGLRARSSK